MTDDGLRGAKQRGSGFSTFIGAFPAVGGLPKWQDCAGMREFRTLAFWASGNAPGRGLECPRLISGPVGIEEGGRSHAGGQRRKPREGTGRPKTWRAARFSASGWLRKARGDRIFSVGGADLWFAPGCGNRAGSRGPVSSFPGECGGLGGSGKLQGLGLAAAKDFWDAVLTKRPGVPGCGRFCAGGRVGSVPGPGPTSAKVGSRGSPTH